MHAHPTHAHAHAHACDCASHRRQAAPSSGGRLAALLPVLACAICPACLSLYAKVFATLGVGFALTETHHALLLAIAVGVSLLFSAARSLRARRLWPITVATVGCALLMLGHRHGGLRWLEWAGIAVLLIGGLREQTALLGRAPRPARPTAATSTP